MNNWPLDFVEIPEGKIAYHRTGGDLPVLLLAHGLTDNGLCWTRVAKFLENDFDIIMLDARGHGLSSRIQPGSKDDHGSDVAHVVEALHLDRPIVLGHSMGARSMAMFANRFPEMTSRVVLEDPPYTAAPAGDSASRSDGFKKQIGKFMTMSLDEIRTYGQKVHSTWLPEEFEAWAIAKQQVDANVMGWYEFVPWQQTMDLIEAPTLLVFGDSDKGGIVSRQIAEEACRINTHVQSTHIPGAGHNIHRERFESYIAAVRTFLL